MPEESEDLKQKIRAVLVDLEKESFKNEVLQELKEAKRGGGFLNHPAVLLVLGFVLTGGVGTWLTSVWQSTEQQRQREQLAHEHALQQKYELTDQINKAVAEAYAGTQVMLHSLWYEGDKKEIAEREAYWNQARRNWIVNSLVLQQKLTINFKRDEDLLLYQKIVDEGEQMGVKIDRAVSILKRSNWKALDDKNVAVNRKQALDMANDMREHTKELLRSLVDDIHKDEGSEP